MGKELNLFLELQLILETGTTKTEFYLDSGREGKERKGKGSEGKGRREKGMEGKERKGKGKEGKGRGVRKMKTLYF